MTRFPKDSHFFSAKAGRDAMDVPPRTPDADVLGDPMTIVQVAALLGCSAWTVRQKYMRQGLPHLRTSARGKLVFFREQVLHWILKQQQKGGL
jgi:hypothetical protein